MRTSTPRYATRSMPPNARSTRWADRSVRQGRSAPPESRPSLMIDVWFEIEPERLEPTYDRMRLPCVRRAEPADKVPDPDVAASGTMEGTVDVVDQPGLADGNGGCRQIIS